MATTPRPLVQLDLTKVRASVMGMMPTAVDMDRLLDGVASAARQRWISIAKQELKSTSRDYVFGIQEAEIKKRVARIDLVGALPNMVEQGWPATDLRRTLLGPGARNVKIGKDGARYNTIPFRHGSPGSGGRNVGTPMPKAIHNVAKTLAPTISIQKNQGRDATVIYGGRLIAKKGMRAEAKRLLTEKSQTWHSSSIYKGMIRNEASYGKTKQSSYTTFRRISSKAKGDSRKWMHPGIKAHNIAKRVAAELGTSVRESLEGIMKAKKVPK